MPDIEITNSDDELVRYFIKHLVPVLFTFEKNGQSHSVVMTAFVLSVGEQWFLITAGHCIRQIEEIVKEYRIAKCHLIDSMGLDAKHTEAIPFTYANSHPTQLSEDESFDYGVMILSTYYRKLLEKNNVQPLNEEVWKCQPPNPISYYLLGIPGELVEVNSSPGEIVTTLHKVEPVSERPEGFSETDIPLFYGHIE